jgi:hypothetical protein
MGATRANLGEIVLERFDRLLHLLVDALSNVSHTHFSLRTCFVTRSAGMGGAGPNEPALGLKPAFVTYCESLHVDERTFVVALDDAL